MKNRLPICQSAYSIDSKHCKEALKDREVEPPVQKVSSKQRNEEHHPPPAMTLIVWNAREICSAERQTELRKMCQERSIEIFGVLETKNKIDKFKEASKKMDKKWVIVRNQDETTRDSIWLG